MTRKKTPGLDNSDRVKYIVRSLFPLVESFQRQDRSSCMVRCKELFIFVKLKGTEFGPSQERRETSGKCGDAEEDSKLPTAGDRRLSEPQMDDIRVTKVSSK